MFNDFETEKEEIQSAPSPDPLEALHQMEQRDVNQEVEGMTEDNLDEFDVFQHEEDRLSFAAKQFKKRMEFNESLKKASKVKSTKDVQYTSATLSAGIPEILYDAEGVDEWVNYLRLYTYTPFTMGMLFVPLAIYGFPEWELFPKLMFGAFYMSTSALFPYFAFRATRDKVNKAWLTPDCNKVIVEKMNFFFQPYKKEYFIRDLRVLHNKGQHTHCWFQCKKTKQQFLFVSELMQHSVWLQLLGVDEEAIAAAKMSNIANDGKVTMFRGSYAR